MNSSITCFALLLIFTFQSFGQSEIYVSDAANFQTGPWKILKFDQDGKNGTVFISQNLGWPQDILFLEEQKVVLISNFTTNRISKYDISTGAHLGNFATGISGPTRMKIGEDGLLYVLQWTGNGKVKRFDLNGKFIDDFTNIGVSNAIGMDWDENENLYISSYDGGYVQKFDKDGKSLGKWITGLAGPTNIYFGEDRNLYVLDYNAGLIKKYDNSGKYLSDFITDVPQCEGIDIMSNGHILVGVGGTSSVKLYDKSGAYIKDLIPSQTLDLKTPNAVVLRDKTSAVVEVISPYKIFDQTIGRMFKFSDALDRGQIKSVSLLSISGGVVADIPYNESHWSADTLSAGTYFVKILKKDNEAYIQKIIIQ